MKSLQEYNSLILESHISRSFYNLGGWRGLFDDLCCEWDQSTMHQKICMIEAMKKMFSINDLIDSYIKFHEVTEGGRLKYILHGLPGAILKYKLNNLNLEIDYVFTD